ncbi:uncharacterized protein TNCV_2909831 [Trichonephila clavipes]|nr:uncharacterized protein TNCV_2909831 [Trichonephila clavipes]
MHMKCPPGKDSWCFYRRALAKGEKPAPHKFNIGTPINPDYLTKIVPIFQRLVSDSLLKGCARCLTQNSNEELHSVIWSKCSKETSAKSRRVNIAVSEAVSEYNFGTLKALKEIQKAANLDLGEEAVKIAATRDYRRKKKEIVKQKVPATVHQIGSFTHDREAALFSCLLRIHLQASYSRRWIGRIRPVSWPPNSPKLNPLDFFFWSLLKSLIFETPVETVEDLTARIVVGSTDIVSVCAYTYAPTI